MTSYVVIFLTLWLIVAIHNEFAWDGTLEAWCINAVIAFALMWPVHWAGGHVVAFLAEGAAQTEREHNDWATSMGLSGCKVTGFAGAHAHPVWTCPDGSAVLQPW